MSTDTAEQTTLKVGQFVLAEITEYPDGFALGVVRGKKRDGSGFDVEILNPNDLEVNMRTIANDDLMPASAGDVSLSLTGSQPFKVATGDNITCFYEELSRHEQRQHHEMKVARLELPGVIGDDITVPEAVKALVKSRKFGVATELLFGTRRGLNHKLGDVGFAVFMAFYAGGVPADLFCQVADNHCWAHPQDEMDGLPIDVYEGETLVIGEPAATRLMSCLRR